MKEKKGIIQYLNIIKCVSIFLVVYCHVTLLNYKGIIDNITMMFCWVAVPCFFMVNGALLFNKKIDMKKHYKKTLKIYSVSAGWKLIYAAIAIVILKEVIINVSKMDVLEYVFLFGKIRGIDTEHLYFIEALLSIYLIFPILYESFKNKDGKKALILLILMIFTFTYLANAVEFIQYCIKQKNLLATLKLDILSIVGLNQISLFGKYSIFLLYFIAGAFLHENKEKISKIKWLNIACWISIIASMLGLLAMKYIRHGTFRWENIYLEDGYVRLCTCIMSIAVFILMQKINIKHIKINSIINEIGSNTLGIFYIHIPLLLIFQKYLYKYILISGVITNIIKTVVTILISWGLIKLIKDTPIIKEMV